MAEIDKWTEELMLLQEAGLLNVLPCSTPGNHAYVRYGNAIAFGDGFQLHSLSTKLANFTNIAIRNLCAWVARARLSSLTILTVAITHIVLMSTKKKVCRILARWAIALMKNMNSIGDWAKVNLPRYALGVSYDAIDDQATISLFAKVSRPFPTFIRPPNVDLAPKSFFNGLLGLKFSPMSPYESHRLTAALTALRERLFCDLRLLSARTLTFAIRRAESIFVNPRGIFFVWIERVLRSMIIHVDKLLSAIGLTAATFTASQRSFY